MEIKNWSTEIDQISKICHNYVAKKKYFEI
jgi:hypothetical protein